MKPLTIAFLLFVNGILGNLIASWIQPGVEEILGPYRLAGTGIGAALTLIVAVILESERALAWNWRWHQFWYCRELSNNPQLREWNENFAQLNLTHRQQQVLGTKVIHDGKRENLIEVLLRITSKPVAKQQSRVLILGEPGSGKTTGLKRLTVDIAQKRTWRFGFGGPIPVLVQLGEFPTESNLITCVAKTLHLATRGRSGKVLGKGVEKLLERGRLILLLDALDEALGKRRQTILAELTQFLNSQAYIQVPVAITARTREEPGSRLGDLEAYIIQELNNEAIRVFIEVYKREEDSEAQILDKLEQQGFLAPGGIGRNPFWLRLIVESGVFRGNKGQIFNKVVNDLLAGEWDKPETIRASWTRIPSKEKQVNETKRALAHLAYYMSTEKQVAIEQEKVLNELLPNYLSSRSSAAGLSPWDIVGLGRDAKLLNYEAGPIRFRHRLLQEFLTAWLLIADQALLTADFIEQYAPDTNWWETFLMLGNLEKGAVDLIRVIAGDGSDTKRLFLSLGMLQSVKPSDSDLRREITLSFAKNLLQNDVTSEHHEMAKLLVKVFGDTVFGTFKEIVKINPDIYGAGIIDVLTSIGSPKAIETLISYLHILEIATHAQAALHILGEPAVEPLIATLQDEDQSVRRYAAEALGQIGDARAVEPLIATLQDNDGHVRLQAAKALGQIGDARAAEPLIAALQDKNWRVWLQAAEALGQIGEPAVEPLVAALWDKDSSAWLQAAEALGQIGEPAVEPLVAALRDKDWSRRLQAARALGQIGDVRAVEPLIATLQDEDQSVRRYAAKALGQIGDARAVEPLIATLQDKDWSRRLQAAEALGQIGDARAVEPLIAALQDNDGQVRLQAAKALGQIGDARAVEPLIAALQDKGWRGRLQAAEALGQIGEPAAEPLIAALQDGDGFVRRYAAEALGQIGEPAAEPLIAALQDGDWDVRRYAAEMLGKIENSRAVASLIAALQDGDWRVRLQAAEALSQIGEPAVESLIAALKDEDWHVRGHVAKALGQIGDARAVKPLSDTLKDKSQYVQEKAAAALRLIGDA